MLGSWINAANLPPFRSLFHHFSRHRLLLQRAGLAASIALVLGASCAPAAAQQNLDAVLTHTNQLFDAGNYDGALAEARKLEAGIKAKFGVNHPNYAIAMNQLLRIYAAQGKYADAEAAAARGLAVRQKVLPPTDPTIAQSQVNLANIYKLEGKVAQAESLYQQALASEQKSLGPDHPDVAENLNNLGSLYGDEGKYAQAEEMLQRALAIRQKTFGPDHPFVAQTLGNAAVVYLADGKYKQAEDAFKQALAIQQKTLGAEHPDVAASYNNLAEVYRTEAKDDEAEALYQHALAIWEKALGPEHPSVALGLRNLADLYRSEANYPQSEAFYQRALAIEQKVLGPDHPETGATLNNFAALYIFESKYTEAEGLLQRALAISQKTYGPDNPDVAKIQQNLGFVYLAEDKPAEAESSFKRALATREKVFGPDSPDVAASLVALATVVEKTLLQKPVPDGAFERADGLYQRALAIETKAYGPDHPNVAVTKYNMAMLYASRDSTTTQALAYVREASAEKIAHMAEDIPGADPTASTAGGTVKPSDVFRHHLAILADIARTGIQPAPALGGEALEMAQWTDQSAAAAAVQQMAARFAGGSALGTLVRERQDLGVAWQVQNKALTDAEAKPQAQQDRAAVDAARKQMADIDGKLAANATKLDKQFPDYAALANPKPLKVEDVQQLLGPNEAMVLFLSGETESYVFAITRDRFDWKTIPLGESALADKVSAFRHGLDIDAFTASVQAGKPELFDAGLANDLYVTLLGPVEAIVKDKASLIVVPTGALTALPFHMLVTDKPADPKPANLAGYRDVAWLIKRQAVSVMPSVVSLKALRGFAKRGDTATKPLIGFADPVFNPNAPPPAAASEAGKPAARSLVSLVYSDFWHGAGVDRSLLSKALPQLPDTATELKTVAQKLNAPAADLHLGRDASVTVVKRAPLTDYHIVYFATHGLVAGDITGLGEPSLVLSIPAQPTDFDNGLLTASEVAQLKLNADWVVLSACNTVAGGRPGAEALSGLARAFFYAGARALLVSQWAVDSDAATRLTTSTFDLLAKDPTLGRAEALRRAMLAYIGDTSNPNAAYPAYWAPFEIVGDGAPQ